MIITSIRWDERRADGKVRVYWGAKPVYWVSPEHAEIMELSARRRRDRYRALVLPARG
jgi:hypothetical protein